MEAGLSSAVSLHFSPLAADSASALPKQRAKGKLFKSKIHSKANIYLRLTSMLQ
ncbi:hypothetical protein Nmel_007405 [Mimus melanotis]